MFGTSEVTLTGRVLVLGEAEDPAVVRLELSMEQDVFFLFSHVMPAEDFPSFAEEQGITVSLAEYPGVLGRILTALAADRSSKFAHLRSIGTDRVRLEVVQARPCNLDKAH